MFERLKSLFRKDPEPEHYDEATLLLGAYSAYLVHTKQVEAFEAWARENGLKLGLMLGEES